MQSANHQVLKYVQGNPSRSNGRSLRTAVKTALTSVPSRNSKGAHSVHPVAISVRTSVWTKLPRVNGPL